MQLHTFLDLGPEVTNETLDWPGGTITKRANSVSLNLFGNLPQHIDLSGLGVTLNKSTPRMEIDS